MHWYWIIDHGRDSPFFQQALKDIPPAVFYLDRILVIDMSRKRRSRRENQRIAGGQSIIVPRGNLPTGFRELLQMLQLHIQHSSLQRVQTGVASDPPMVVFAFLAMIGNHADTGSQRLVGSHQRPPIAIAGQRLGWKKRCRPDMSDRPGLSYPPVGKDIIGTNRLSVIFHYIQMIDICQSHDRLHIAGLSEQVDGHDRLCPFRNSRFYFPGIDIKGTGIDIHQHGRQP